MSSACRVFKWFERPAVELSGYQAAQGSGKRSPARTKHWCQKTETNSYLRSAIQASIEVSKISSIPLPAAHALRKRGHPWCASSCCFEQRTPFIAKLKPLRILRFLLGAGSPLGGARPKSALSLAKERLAIAKFPKSDDTQDNAASEILALKLAAMSGIQVVEDLLVPVSGDSLAVITRFECMGKNRVPFISASSLLGDW